MLAGWAFDVAVLKSLIPGLTAMNPGGSALAFLLAGVSLWAQASEVRPSRRRAVGIACAAGVLLIGLARVGGYLAGWDGGPDQLLFREDLEREARAARPAQPDGAEHGRGVRRSSGWHWRCSTWRPSPQASGPPSSSPWRGA